VTLSGGSPTSLQESGLTPYQILILYSSAGGFEVPQGKKEAEQLIGTNGEQLLPGIKSSYQRGMSRGVS